MRLQSVAALEAFSPLTGEPVLVVDLRAREKVARSALARARARLAELPCPTVALVATPGDAGALAGPLADRFDVVVAGEDDLAPILAAVARTPLAAMALVQLLRYSAALDVHDALVAESLVYATLQGGPELARWLAARRGAAGEVPALGVGASEAAVPSMAAPAAVSPAAQAAVSPAAAAVSPGSAAASQAPLALPTATAALAPVETEPAVLATRDGTRLALALNRPARHNAYSTAMRDTLAEALAVAVDDPSITEIVLTGRGPSFCSGGDLDEFGTRPDPATAHAIRSTRNVGRLLAACADRVRVELHGACIGAGIELAAFAGRVTATRDAYVELPEVAMGLIPGAGGTVSIPRRIGRQRTALLALTGMRLDAATAARWGLIDAVVG